MHRLEFLAGRDLADITVVGETRRLMIDVHALGTGAAARPGFQFHIAQVLHVVRADDVEPVVAYETQVGRILLGAEFICQLLGNDGVFRHIGLPFLSLRFSIGNTSLRASLRASQYHEGRLQSYPDAARRQSKTLLDAEPA